MLLAEDPQAGQVGSAAGAALFAGGEAVGGLEVAGEMGAIGKPASMAMSVTWRLVLSSSQRA